MSFSVAAEPLWKCGARAASPRSVETVTLPMSAHLPVISAKPGSFVRTTPPRYEVLVHARRNFDKAAKVSDEYQAVLPLTVASDKWDAHRAVAGTPRFHTSFQFH